VENEDSSFYVMKLLKRKTRKGLNSLENMKYTEETQYKMADLIHPYDRDLLSVFGSLLFINHLLQYLEHQEENNDSHLV
jgi:hypothetical protein